MKKLGLIGVLLISFLMGRTQAELSLAGQPFESISDSVFMGGTCDIGVFIKNTGDEPFDGWLYLIFYNTELDSATNEFALDTLALDSATVQIAPGDSVFKTTTKPVNQNSFRLNEDVIVIWPYSEGVPHGNEYTGSVWVIGLDAIEDLSILDWFKIRKHQIFIDPNKRFKDVRIYSLNGQLLKSQVSQFDLSSCAAGVYLLTFIDQSGQVYTVKLWVN